MPAIKFAVSEKAFVEMREWHHWYSRMSYRNHFQQRELLTLPSIQIAHETVELHAPKMLVEDIVN